MMEAHYTDGSILREGKPLDAVLTRMQELLEDPAVVEIRTRKIEVGEEVDVVGRTLRFTAGGWRRLDRHNPHRTHDLTPVERRLVGNGLERQ